MVLATAFAFIARRARRKRGLDVVLAGGKPLHLRRRDALVGGAAQARVVVNVMCRRGGDVLFKKYRLIGPASEVRLNWDLLNCTEKYCVALPESADFK